MNQILFTVMALGAILGGLDYLLGNRLGLGKSFAEAFGMLGSIGLSMAGILCLAPVMSTALRVVASPAFSALHLDPGILGGILPIDMGGYQMARDLARDPAIGQFSGILLSATFGCTLVFTLPVGMGAMEEDDRTDFLRGLLLGISLLPVSLLAGGMAMGLSPAVLAWNCLPVFLLCLGLLAGLRKSPLAVARSFRTVSDVIGKIAILGLTLGAVRYMTGFEPIPGMLPLEEAMEVVCSIAIVMLGSLPLSTLLQRLLKKPFHRIREKTGLNESSTTGLLIGVVSVVPALALFPKMDRRGKVINGAFLVCGASTFAAHLGFTFGMEPELTGALLLTKLLGGLLAAAVAFFTMKAPHS